MPHNSLSSLEQAYHYCLQRVQQHYENFPVASLLLPKTLRRPISVIYCFARNADDFADEGDASAQQRLAQLDDYSQKLRAISSGNEATRDPVFLALADVIKNHQLPLQLFEDLLLAFRQDVIKTRYSNYEQVLDYCSHSANPVGRLLLHLTAQDSALNLQRSDAICSALQLINFLQDLAQDYDENNRIYLPQDEMQRYGVSEQHLRNKTSDQAFGQLIKFQIARTRELMLSGALLGNNIPGRFGLQLRMMINGGLQVLQLLDRQEDFFSRPRLKTVHWLNILWHAINKTYIDRPHSHKND